MLHSFHQSIGAVRGQSGGVFCFSCFLFLFKCLNVKKKKERSVKDLNLNEVSLFLLNKFMTLIIIIKQMIIFMILFMILEREKNNSR